MVVFVSHQLGNANANVTLGGDAKVFDLSRSASVFGQMSFAAGPNRGNVVSDPIDGNTYSASVNVARPSMVMLKATFHPGWHATVDGIAVETVMLMPSYAAVRAGPGTHRVRFEYQPPKFRWLLLHWPPWGRAATGDGRSSASVAATEASKQVERFRGGTEPPSTRG